MDAFFMNCCACARSVKRLDKHKKTRRHLDNVRLQYQMLLAGMRSLPKAVVSIVSEYVGSRYMSELKQDLFCSVHFELSLGFSSARMYRVSYRGDFPDVSLHTRGYAETIYRMLPSTYGCVRRFNLMRDANMINWTGNAIHVMKNVWYLHALHGIPNVHTIARSLLVFTHMYEPMPEWWRYVDWDGIRFDEFY